MSTTAMLRPELGLKKGKSPAFTSFYFSNLRTFKKIIVTERTN